MTTTVKFEKIVGGGKALGYVDGRPWFAAGPLPGETAEVEIVRDKPGFVEAQVVKIVEAAAERSLSAEEHFLECSPWQNVTYDHQLELKRRMLVEVFARPGLALPVTGMVGAPVPMGYRNKLEFSLKKTGDKLELAFHARGSYEELIALPEGCRLGSAAMNEAALLLVERVAALKLSGYIETLTVRQSVSSGNVLGMIALHQVPKRAWSDLAISNVAGLVVTRVRHRDQHELLWHTGEPQLIERLGGLDLAYPYDGFFQTNPGMFEQALKQILEAIPAGCKLIDLYGGVGAIGLAAAATAQTVTGIEIKPTSVEWATANADRNGIRNYTGVCAPAERLDAGLLKGADCVVVDPPRAGLHGRVIDDLLEAAPARIIYLSCNPATQARDVMLLAGAYSASGVTGFDFYPGTLHVESLVVLDRV